MTMQEIVTQMNDQAQEYNAALTDKKYDELPAITKKMDDLQAEYAKLAKQEFLDISKGVESPLKDALTRLTYKVVVYKDNADKETQTVTRVITDKVKQISLAECFSAFPSAFRSPQWKYYVEKFNQLLCLNVADEIGATTTEKELIRNKFAMQQASRELDLGKPSNTMLLKTLQRVIDQIYYEEEEFKSESKSGTKTEIRNRIRVTSHDIKFLQHAYTKLGREVKRISTLNSGKLANVLAQVLNKLITETAYGVDFKQAKDVPAAGEVKVVKEKNSKSKKDGKADGKKKGRSKKQAEKQDEKQDGKPVPEATTDSKSESAA